MTEGVSSALPQSKPCGFASSLGEGASGEKGDVPLPSTHYVRSHLPQGDGFCAGRKLCGFAKGPISEGAGAAAAATGGVVTAGDRGGSFPRSAALSQKAALQMPPAVTPPPVKMRLERSAERDKREI